MISALAPQASPAYIAMSPQCRPITWTMFIRLWEKDVSLILLIASIAVDTAVSKPMV